MGHAPDMSSTAGALPRLHTNAVGLANISSSPLNHAAMTPIVMLPPPLGLGSHTPRMSPHHPRMSPSVVLLPPAVMSSHHTPRSLSHHPRMTPSVILPPPSGMISQTPRLSPMHQSPSVIIPPVGGTPRRSQSTGQHRRSSSHHENSPNHLQPPVANEPSRRGSTVRPVPIDECCPDCCPDLRRSASGGSGHGKGSYREGSSRKLSVSSTLRPINEVPVVRQVSRSRSARPRE